ncbi:MAG TPA: ABC transporter substrate-binding protein [Aliidongia sp.]|uniref:ABC transporter substrate-binding protein n=1 Tax=Aliidongia sp. TaxID=1914230 RepID=UPI002DDD78EB|nr:ABC transporter substrate-binding protein [Aliidongia sp.]HEV2676415.1 ABC transporter substrate-binding protein [Aliidongia sp.]
MFKGTMVTRFGLALGLAASLITAHVPMAQAETITVTHWGGQFYGVPYAVAMDKGFFKERGIDVTGILTAAGGGTAIRNTLAGDIPFGEVSLAAAVQAVNAGQPLVIVGAGTQSVADQVWLVKKDSPLKSIKDLVGKQIAYTSPASVSNMIILMALKANGMTQSQVKLVPAGDLGANLSAVTSGAVDAGFSDELIYAQNKEISRPLFYVRDVMSPKMMQTVLVTTTEYAKAHPDAIKALIAGRRAGLVYTREHPDEAADITAKAYNNPNKDLFRTHMKELVKENYWSDGGLDYEAMDHMVEGLQITGQLKDKVDWPKYVDTAFLPTDLRASK